MRRRGTKGKRNEIKKSIPYSSASNGSKNGIASGIVLVGKGEGSTGSGAGEKEGEGEGSTGSDVGLGFGVCFGVGEDGRLVGLSVGEGEGFFVALGVGGGEGESEGKGVVMNVGESEGFISACGIGEGKGVSIAPGVCSFKENIKNRKIKNKPADMKSISMTGTKDILFFKARVERMAYSVRTLKSNFFISIGCTL